MSARPPVSLGVHIPEDQIKALAEAVKPSGDELAKLVYAIAEAVASKLSLVRSSYTPAEVASRNGYSVDFVYREIREGRLVAVRPGARSELRVLPEHERTWLFGQSAPGTEPAIGLDPKRAASLSQRRRRL